MFVNVQEICAPATTFAAGMVRALPTKVPKLAGLLVMAALASVQLAVVAVKPAARVSVIVTAVFKAVALLAVGEDGVGVAAAVVVIAAGLVTRFVEVKLNGPPTAPTVIFCNTTVAGFGVLVNMHATASPYAEEPKFTVVTG